MVTHHLTSYVIAALLVAWTVMGLLTRGYRESMGPGGMALISVVLVLTWLGYVATVTVSYLVAPVGGAVASFLSLLLSEEQGRALFQAATATGIVAPPWERVLGFAAASWWSSPCRSVLFPSGAARGGPVV